VAPEARKLTDEEIRETIEKIRARLRSQSEPQQSGMPADLPPGGAYPYPPDRAAGVHQPAGGTMPQPARRPAVALQPGAENRIVIGSDHGGFELKERLGELLEELGFETLDVGCHGPEAVDYPDFAVKVARTVARGEAFRGIMIDGAGIGSSMAANKVPGCRAATCHNVETVVNSREHNNANVLVIGSGQVGRGLMRQMVRVWLKTEFAGGRHERRVAKIDELDGF
jgi:ribose 5-phosphate isomerase B